VSVGALETPMMQQFLKVKAQHPDAIIFYRMGDFYEMFLGDAELAAPLLDIALTTRDKGKPDAVPMCGVPVHAADGHIKRLAELGHRVAICEQVEDPRALGGRRLVRREVVEVVTPGLVGDPEGLDGRTVVSLVAICWSAVESGAGGRRFGLAALDASTGDFRATELVVEDDGGGGGAGLASARSPRAGALANRAAGGARPGRRARGLSRGARRAARSRRRQRDADERLRGAASDDDLAGHGASRRRRRDSGRPRRRELPDRESTLRGAPAADPRAVCPRGHGRPRRRHPPPSRALREQRGSRAGGHADRGARSHGLRARRPAARALARLSAALAATDRRTPGGRRIPGRAGSASRTAPRGSRRRPGSRAAAREGDSSGGGAARSRRAAGVAAGLAAGRRGAARRRGRRRRLVARGAASGRGRARAARAVARAPRPARAVAHRRAAGHRPRLSGGPTRPAMSARAIAAISTPCARAPARDANGSRGSRRKSGCAAGSPASRSDSTRSTAMPSRSRSPSSRRCPTTTSASRPSPTSSASRPNGCARSSPG
jgi:hypothetical protein